MSVDAIIVLVVLLVAIVLFATEIVSIDLTAILVMLALVLSGVISPEEGVRGFSNSATITVAFMFVLSSALYKTGSIQLIGPGLANIFRKNFSIGMIILMLVVASISSFINNTPVVAIFIPIVVQLAENIGKSPTKMLIPISFAAIFGGTCTLIGTSTNILVSGIAEMNGMEPFSMFKMTPMGIILLIIGILYTVFIGIRLLPNRKSSATFNGKYTSWGYLTEIVLEDDAGSVGKQIMDSSLVKDYQMDIVEIRRNGNHFVHPSGDIVLMAGDVLKVNCKADKLNQLKNRVHINVRSPISMGEEKFSERHTSLVELIIPANSEFEGLTLRQADFRRKYRAIPLAIKTRDEIIHERLHDVPLKSGDVLLAEVKTHFLNKLRTAENSHESPFIILSAENKHVYNKRNTRIVVSVLFLIVLLATLNVVPIMIGAILGSSVIVTTRCLRMKEVYEAINWNVIFLLAGALSLGTAMQKSGLAEDIANSLVILLGRHGPVFILSGLYLMTSFLTEVMSNNASAALLAPIAIAIAHTLNKDPVPFLMVITFAASASFMTPVGYQTNTMIYNAGDYRFLDFLKVGTLMNILFWIVSSLLIPIFYPL